MSSRTVLIDTDANGDFLYEAPLFAAVLAVKVDIGTLEQPDITVEDPDEGNTFASWTNLATDAFEQVSDPPDNYIVCSGTLRVTVANAGDTKHGHVRLLLWG